MSITYRPATADDVAAIKWTLFTALAWSPEREELVRRVTLDHPEAARYHVGWGRRGDLGVIAMEDDELVGAAYCRLFTEEDHGHGYLDEMTPELAVGVRADRRGRGLGTELVTRLATAAKEAGFARLSLSVDSDNPARRLYERLGYRTVADDDEGVRMVIDLG